MELATRIVMWSFQVAAFTAAILFWQNYKNTTQKYFLYFLGYVLITECLGFTIPKIYGVKSQSIYNVFTIISVLFYLFWFYKIVKFKKIVIIFIPLFLLSIIYAIFFENFFKNLWVAPLITGTIVVLISSVLYYYDLLERVDIVNYQKLQPFWIVTGLLIFYVGFLPLLLFQPYLASSNYYIISILILNAIMYGFFTISFLCLKNKK